jgi:3-methylcrotonyl-CoA carboxylase alpha subunit
MGHKTRARQLMARHGMPMGASSGILSGDWEEGLAAARRIGFPVLVKPATGGGGIGMLPAHSEEELAAALARAASLARRSFDNAELYLERLMMKPRHIEFQMAADRHGAVRHLFERDCSIQRRHQKVVEEAPAPGLSAELRRAMGEAAVKAAQAIGYVGAGTVEFLLDSRGDFFFMEMNTRLQVEHPVTEAITGLDLVAWQIRVANGEVLPIMQDEVPLNGHAIEVRLYAEDTEQDFLPASGTLTLYREPATGPGRRVDSGVSEGDSVSPFYDPMLAKLIAWGETREEARLRLLAMLDELAVGGFKTNLPFLRRVLAHAAFAAAELDTSFIPRYHADLLPPPTELPQAFWQLAAAAFINSEPARQRTDDAHSPWTATSGWRAGLPAQRIVHLRCNGISQVIRPSGNAQLCGDQLLYTNASGVQQRLQAIRQGDTLYLEWNGELQVVTRVDAIAEVEASHAHHGGLVAPMNGSIVRVLVEPGQAIKAGTALVVLEAMKMEHSIRAPQAGTIKALYCAEGDMVSEGAALVELEE